MAEAAGGARDQGDRGLVSVPTQFMRDWVAAHYADRIRMLWNGVNTQIRSINLVVAQGRGAAGSPGTIVNREQPPLKLVEPQPRPVNDLPESCRCNSTRA